MKWRLSVLFLTGLCSLTRCLPHQYHFVGSALAWLKAQTYCRERHTDLATVFNVEDMNRLVNAAQDSTGGFTGKAWIGLYDNLTSWRWSFSDSRYYGDEEGNYRNWDFGQPDNFIGDQMCVKMWRGGVWEDSPCFLRNPFICYDGTASANQRFVFVERELSWSEAQLYCRRRYTDLASVRNGEENQEMQHLAKSRSVWIGLYRSGYGNGPIKVALLTATGSKASLIMSEGSRSALPLIWAMQACGRMKSAAGSLFLSAMEKTVSGSVSGLVKASVANTARDKTPDEPVLSTTLTSNKITTTKGDSATSQITSMTPNKGTTAETLSTSGHKRTEITSFEQPSTLAMDQTRPITDETSEKPILSTTTTTVIRNEIIMSEGESTSAETPSSAQLSTPELHQTTSIPDENPQKSSYSGISTLTPNERTTTEIESTTGHLSIERTSSEPSTSEVDQTRSISYETPNQPALSTTKMTTNEEDSTSAEFSSQQFSTPKVDQTRNPALVVNLRVEFTSKIRLSEDYIKELVLVEFHYLLMEKGLPTSIKVGLKRPLK